jgi:hypothetical protein
LQSSIPDSTKQYVSGIFRREHLRGLAVMFGIGEERPFYVEKNPALLLERLRHNVTFFYLNYFCLTAVLFLVQTLLSPTTLVGAGLLGLAWMSMIRASASGSLLVGSLHIPQKTALAGMAVVSAFVLLWLFKSVFWWTMFSSGFLVAIHAFARDASMHKDMDDVVHMEGDLTMEGEDASFLNNHARVNLV